MTGESVSGKVRRNTRWQILAYTISEGTRFLLVPVVIEYIALEGYSLVRIAYTFYGFFALYSFGIHGAYVKYTAECHQRGEYARLNGLLSVGVSMCVVFGGITVALVVWQREWIAHQMKPDAQQPETVEFMIVYVAALAAVCVVFGVYRAILTGLQRMDATNLSVIAFNFVQVIVVLGLLFNGYGVRMVIAVYGIALAGPLILMMLAVWRIAPEIRIRPWAIRRDSWRPMLSLGGRMQVLGIVALAAVSIDAVVLFRIFPEAFVGAYLVARQFASRIQTIPMLGFGALVPAGADLLARNAHDTVNAVYETTQRITVIITAYLFIFLIVNGDLLLVAYLGPAQYSDIAWRALIALCFASLIHTVTGPGSSLLRGAGKPGLEIIYQGLTVVLFIGFVYAALHYPATVPEGEVAFADWGVLLSMPLALSIASTVFLIGANRRFGARWMFPFDKTFLPIVGGLLVATLLRVAVEFATIAPEDNRWIALVVVGGMGVLYSLAFMALAWSLPGLTATDKDQLVRLVPLGNRIRARIQGASNS